MAHRVVFVQGGGVGIDQEAAVRRLLGTLGVHVEFEVHLAGRASLEAGREALSNDLFDVIRSTGLALKTRLHQPEGAGPQGPANFNIEFRRRLGLFASVRPVRNLPGLPSRFNGIEFLLVREISEDLYATSEHEIVPGVVQSFKIVRAGPPPRPPVHPLHSQGEHPQAGRRTVPRLLPAGGSELSRDNPPRIDCR
jgi:isocitrate dehydrogenase (NAD+)